MGLVHGDFDSDPAREIAAEASSEIVRPPSYEEMWGRAGRPVAPREQPEARRDRWPVFATIIAIVIGATAMIAMRERLVAFFRRWRPLIARSACR